jgi:hypothetical protein
MPAGSEGIGERETVMVRYDHEEGRLDSVYNVAIQVLLYVHRGSGIPYQ